MKKANGIRLSEKYALLIEEEVQYFQIGERKLRQLNGKPDGRLYL